MLSPTLSISIILLTDILISDNPYVVSTFPIVTSNQTHPISFFTLVPLLQATFESALPLSHTSYYNN